MTYTPFPINSSNINVTDTAPLSYRNKLINGNFDIWQRGVLGTYSANAGPYFQADRWFHSQLGNGVSDEIVELISNTSSGLPVGNNLMRIRQFKAIGFDGGNSRICQIIESANTVNLRGQVCTLSFSHRVPLSYSTYSGNWIVNVQYDTNDSTINSSAVGAAGAETLGANAMSSVFRLPSAGTNDNWTKSSFTFTMPTTAKRVMIVFYSSGNTSNSACLDIAQVQLESGSQATAFEYRPIGLELQLCQRYYEKINAGRTTGLTYTPNGDTRSMTTWAVEKRATPAVSYTGSTSVIAHGSAGEVINIGLGTLSLVTYGLTTVAISYVSNHAAFSGCGAVMSWGDNGGGNLTYIGSAEL